MHTIPAAGSVLSGCDRCDHVPVRQGGWSVRRSVRQHRFLPEQERRRSGQEAGCIHQVDCWSVAVPDSDAEPDRLI